MSEADAERRLFLRTHAALVGLAVAALVPASASVAGGAGEGADRIAATPPGSVSHARYFRRCVACQICVTACPSRVLRPGAPLSGPGWFAQPRRDFTSGYCNYDCALCGEVCPSGAILPLAPAEKHQVQTGVARFTEPLCVVAAKHENCGACAEHCPTLAVQMVPWTAPEAPPGLRIPQVTPDLCVGCGACEHACPVTPERAIVVEGLAEHATARLLDKGREVERQVEEFGF